MNKFIVSMAALAFSAALLSGCGGGGGGGGATVTPTTTVNTSGGAAMIASAQNASANIIVDDFSSTGWKFQLPAGSLTENTTFTFVSITPGNNGAPSVPADRIIGAALAITSAPAIPAGRTLTIMNDASQDADIAVGSTVDLMKVVSGVWTDVGAVTKFSDGSLRSDVSGFSQIAIGVMDSTGTYNETFTTVASSNTSFCGSVGSVDNSVNIIDQNGVAMTFNPADSSCVTKGYMKADGAFAGTSTCSDLRGECTVTTTSNFAGTLDISSSPKRYSAAVSTTNNFAGVCAPAPASCSLTGAAAGVLMF